MYAGKNWEQVFGKDPSYWFLPLWGPGPCDRAIRKVAPVLIASITS